MLNENDFALLVISIGITHNNGNALKETLPVGVALAGTLALSTPEQRLSFHQQAIESINQNITSLAAIADKINVEIERLKGNEH